MDGVTLQYLVSLAFLEVIQKSQQSKREDGGELPDMTTLYQPINKHVKVVLCITGTSKTKLLG